MDLVSLNEFRDLANLRTGDEVEVMVIEKEDREGHLHLRQTGPDHPCLGKDRGSTPNGEVVTGTVTSKTKGGLIVDVFGMGLSCPGRRSM